MERKLCNLLQAKARELAAMYSDPKKARKNVHGVKYEVESVDVCSDLTGTVTLKKSNGQRAVIFCYWLNYNTRDGNGGEFRWLTLRYDHLFGMQKAIDIVHRVEQMNFASNTKPVRSMAEHDEWWAEYDGKAG